MAVEDDIDKIIDEKFFLEISSPGVERPLKKEKDYIRFTGDCVDSSDFLWFQIHFRIICSSSGENVMGNLIGITLNL